MSPNERVEKKESDHNGFNFYNVAIQNVQTMFVSTSGRAYSKNRTGFPMPALMGLPNSTGENNPPYAHAIVKDKTLTFEFNGKKLFLDFENLTHEVN